MSGKFPPILGMIWPDRCDQENRWLRRKSEVFRYAMEGTKAKDEALLGFVSEQCVASARLMQIAVSQYESVASGMQGSAFERRTLPAWMFISCASSAVDACVAAIAAIVSGVAPETENGIAGVNSFATVLKKLKQGGHDEILKSVEDLRASAWYSALSEARHRVIHRGWWPIKDWMITGDSWHLVHSAFFLQKDLEGNRRQPLPDVSRGEVLDLKQIAEGLLWRLEEWESSIAGILAMSPFIESRWRGPVRQVIPLDNYDSSLPEACFLAEKDNFTSL